jgi:Fe-S cluster assembly protein SufD
MALRNQISKEEFLSVFNDLPLESLAELEWKEKSRKNFIKLDFPAKTDEIWRHTSINRLLQHHYSLGKKMQLDRKTVDSFTIPGLDAYRLVFINGYFAPEYSNQIDNNNLIIKNIAQAKAEHKDLFDKFYENTSIAQENFFTNLNTAFATNGNFIFIPKGVILDKANSYSQLF